MTDGIKLECVKQKDAEPCDPIGVAVVRVGIGDDASLILSEEIDIKEESLQRHQLKEDAFIRQVLKY